MELDPGSLQPGQHHGSGGASALLMAGPTQVISSINKNSKNLLIYNFLITSFDCQGGGIAANECPLARPGVTHSLLKSEGPRA